MNTKSDRRLIIAKGLVFAALLTIFFYGISLSFTKGALYDMWEMFRFIQSWDQGTFTIRDAFEKHNAIHIEAVPKIFYFVEYFVFHGQNYFLLSVSIVCLLLCYVIILKNILEGMSGKDRLWIFVAVSVVFYSGWQIPNLVYVYQVQWYLSWIFTLVAIMLIARDRTIGSRYLYALLFAVLASLCNFSGVVTLLLVIVCGIFYSNNRLFQGCLCLVFVTVAWLFYPDKSLYKIGNGVTIDVDEYAKLYLQSIVGQYNQKTWFPWFFVAYLRRLASPITEFSGNAGLIAGALILWLLLGSIVRSGRAAVSSYFWILLTIYALLLVAAITQGRYQGGGLDNSRYVTASIMVMVCVIYWFSCRFLKYVRWSAILWTGFFMVLGLVTINQEALKAVRREKANINIQNGIFYNAAYEKTYFWVLAIDYNPFRLYHDYLKQNEMDIFYNNRKSFVEGDYTLDQCVAVSKKSYYLPRNNIKDYYLDLWDISTHSAIDSFYLVKDGQVMFYGTTYPRGNYWLPMQFQKRSNLESYTSIPGNFNLHDFEIVGENVDGQYCHITWGKGGAAKTDS